MRQMIVPEAAAFAAMVEASQANLPGIAADLRFRGILAAGRNPPLLQMGNLIGVGLLISHRFRANPSPSSCPCTAR